MMGGFPRGAWLGAVRTLEDLMQRCYVDPDSGCWHWRMAIYDGAPRVYLWRADGSRMITRGRRAALYLRHGKNLPRGHVAYAKHTCRSHDCVNPDHCTSGSRARWGKVIAESGVLKGSPAKVAANAVLNKARRALSDEQVRHVRASEETHTELAKRLGVSASLIADIRRGRRYAEPAPMSIFTFGTSNVR